MRKAALILAAVLLLAAPGFARAQNTGMDKQNPGEYTDDDSQPLKLLSYALAPIGFALEWGVVRPLHYLATDSFLAPILSATTDSDKMTVAPIAELPPLDTITDTTKHEDVTIVPSTAPPPTNPAAEQKASPVSVQPSQPVLH